MEEQSAWIEKHHLKQAEATETSCGTRGGIV